LKTHEKVKKNEKKCEKVLTKKNESDKMTITRRPKGMAGYLKRRRGKGRGAGHAINRIFTLPSGSSDK
jgi:hypothetical protein